MDGRSLIPVFSWTNFNTLSLNIYFSFEWSLSLCTNSLYHIESIINYCLFTGIYLTIVMSLTSLSVIMTVFVLNLHHRGPSKQAVPVWLRNIFLGRMARWLCLPGGEPTYRDYYSGDTAQFLRKVSLKMTIENMAQELKDDLENGVADTLLDQSGLPFSNEKQESRTNSTLSNDHYRRTNNKNPRNVSKTNEEILRALKRLIEKHDREDHEYEIIQEWRKVAQVVDRILFWIFLTGTLVSTLTVLVIAPLTRSF